jgi:hypothetical protein
MLATGHRQWRPLFPGQRERDGRLDALALLPPSPCPICPSPLLSHSLASLHRTHTHAIALPGFQIKSDEQTEATTTDPRISRIGHVNQIHQEEGTHSRTHQIKSNPSTRQTIPYHPSNPIQRGTKPHYINPFPSQLLPIFLLPLPTRAGHHSLLLIPSNQHARSQVVG